MLFRSSPEILPHLTSHFALSRQGLKKFPAHAATASPLRSSQMALVVKNPPATTGDMDLIPGLGRSPGGRHGNPPQCSCLENLMDRRTWWTTVHKVAKSRTQLKQLSRYACREIMLRLSLFCHDFFGLSSFLGLSMSRF